MSQDCVKARALKLASDWPRWQSTDWWGTDLAPAIPHFRRLALSASRSHPRRNSHASAEEVTDLVLASVNRAKDYDTAVLCCWCYCDCSDRVSLCSPGWPETYCVVQTGFKLAESQRPLLPGCWIKGVCYHTCPETVLHRTLAWVGGVAQLVEYCLALLGVLGSISSKPGVVVHAYKPPLLEGGDGRSRSSRASSS